MILVVFIIVLAADFLLTIGVAISIFFPRHRIWPPPKKSSWQFWVSWIFSIIGMGGSPLLGILDFESLGSGNWIGVFTGILVIVIGGSFALWGTTTLSSRQSLGLKGKLVTNGPYQYSRNPQYVGFITMYVGIILATLSFMALVTGIIVIIIFWILPFSEEPMLRQQYGKTYEEYCNKVPRFIGLRSFKPKLLC